jgi:hypothetical protein
MSLATCRAAGRLASTACTVLLALTACSPDAASPLAPDLDPRADLAASRRPHEGFNRSVPFFYSDFVPCAAGGQGEWVTVEGAMHEHWTFHTDASGTSHASAHMNPQGLTGTGWTTGDRYNAVGNLRIVHNYDDGRIVGGAQNRTTFVGRGNGVRFEMVLRTHEVQRPDGSWVLDRDEAAMSCSS